MIDFKNHGNYSGMPNRRSIVDAPKTETEPEKPSLEQDVEDVDEILEEESSS